MIKVESPVRNPLNDYFTAQHQWIVILDVLKVLSKGHNIKYLPGGLKSINHLHKELTQGMVVTINSRHIDGMHNSSSFPCYSERIKKIVPKLNSFYILNELSFRDLKVHAHLIFNSVPSDGDYVYWFDIEALNENHILPIHDYFMTELNNSTHNSN